MTSDEQLRLDRIGHEVRRAVGRLRGLERVAIEGYYFDGMSIGRLARREGVSTRSLGLAQKRALTELRATLAAFVEEWYGIAVTHISECAICAAAWRQIAEAILDEKTPEVTWGELMKRIERATGWKARSPQVLIAHQRKHRKYGKQDKGEATTDEMEMEAAS